MNCLSLVPVVSLVILPVSDGGLELDVGDGDEMGTSSCKIVGVFRGVVTHCFFVLRLPCFSWLDEVTTLLLLLVLRVFNAGESCSLEVGGEGGEFAGQPAAKRPGWKKAGFGGRARPLAASICDAIRSWDGVNIAVLPKFGNDIEDSGLIIVDSSSGISLPKRSVSK